MNAEKKENKKLKNPKKCFEAEYKMKKAIKAAHFHSSSSKSLSEDNESQ